MKKMYEHEIRTSREVAILDIEKKIAELEREREIVEMAIRIITERCENGLDNRPLTLNSVITTIKTMQHLDDASIYAFLVKRGNINIAEN